MKLKPLCSLVLAVSLVSLCYANNDRNLDYGAVVNLVGTLLPSSESVNLNRLINREIEQGELSDLIDLLMSELEYSAAKRAELAKSLYDYSKSEVLGVADVLDNLGGIDAKPTHKEIHEAIDDVMANGGTEEIASFKDAILEYIKNDVIDYLGRYK